MDGFYWKCSECGWIGKPDDALHAHHPFSPPPSSDEIVGCPKCYEVNTMQMVCDEPGCKEVKTCGFPTDAGYRQTCGKHYIAASAVRGGKG